MCAMLPICYTNISHCIVHTYFVLVMSFSKKCLTDTDRNQNLGKISDRIPTDNIPSQNLTEIWPNFYLLLLCPKIKIFGKFWWKIMGNGISVQVQSILSHCKIHIVVEVTLLRVATHGPQHFTDLVDKNCQESTVVYLCKEECSFMLQKHDQLV